MAAEARKSSIDVKVFLQLGEESAWTELDNVSDIPDLGAAPEQIEVTAIGDKARKYINGILETDELEFTCFYEADKFEAVREAKAGQIGVKIGDKDIVVKGQISASLSGFGVGDAISYTLRVAVEEISFTETITVA